MKNNTNNNFDASGVTVVLNISDWKKDPDARRLGEDIKIAAETIIDHLEKGDLLRLITYDADFLSISPVFEVEADNRSAREAVRKIISHLDEVHEEHRFPFREGIQRAVNELGPNSSLFLISDSVEDEHQLLETLLRDIKLPVYVLGIGAHNVVFEHLKSLSGAIGGHALFTGPDASRYRLQRFVVQTINHIFGRNVVFGGSGLLHPGSKRRTSFQISETDNWQHVTLLSSSTEHLEFFLQSPMGHILKPEAARPGGPVDFYRDAHQAFFRLLGPIQVEEDRPAWQGEWHILLESHAEHDVDYYLLVTSHSEISFRARAMPSENDPGKIRIISRYTGVEHVAHLAVRGEVTTPSGQELDIGFYKDEQGDYEVLFQPPEPGHYDVALKFRGINIWGSSFEQEKHITFNVSER